MRSRSLCGVLLVGLLACLTILSACGDDDNSDNSLPSPTFSVTADEKLEPYFDKLDAIFERASEDSAEANDELNTRLQEADGDLTKEKAAMTAFLEATAGLFDTAINGMDELDVPAQATDDHDSFVAAAKGSVLLASNLKDELGDVDTTTEAQALIDEFNTDYQPLLQSADTACTNLQNLATAAGLDTDLACQG